MQVAEGQAHVRVSRGRGGFGVRNLPDRGMAGCEPGLVRMAESPSQPVSSERQRVGYLFGRYDQLEAEDGENSQILSSLYGVCMELVWSLYGTTRNQHPINTLAIGGHDARRRELG
jgi:hypothetical protein